MAHPPLPDLTLVPRHLHAEIIQSHRLGCIEADIRELQIATGLRKPEASQAPAVPPANPLLDGAA